MANTRPRDSYACLSPRQWAINAYDLVTGRTLMASLAGLNRSQWSSRKELLALQQGKLYRLLQYANEFVPYYRRMFAEVGFRPGDILTDPTAYLELPTLSKSRIRDNFDDLITTDPMRRKRLEQSSTGGSTGQTLIFMHDSGFRDHATADLHRHLQWTGWQWGEPYGYLWGAAHEIAVQKKLRTRLMDWAFNRHVTSAFALSEESMLAFARQIQRTRIKLLLGYASALERLARFVSQQGLDDLQLLGVVSSAEVLFPHQRQLIERTFGCQVLDRYGTRELGGIACECSEHMGLHVSVEDVYLEILHDGVPAPLGEAGEIVVTNLNNYGMPLIRYEVEDIGQLTDRECRCGRGLPMMEIVHGRNCDMFKTLDGKTVHGLAFIKMFRTTPEVEQFQVVQKAYDHIVVTVVERSPLPPERIARFEAAIQEIMQSDIRVDVRLAEAIPILASGKYRFTVCEIE